MNLSISNKVLHFSAQADKALFNNPIANALSTQTGAAFVRMEQGVVNGASGATRAFLDAEYNPNANLFFSLCAKVSGQWEAARQALGSYVGHRQGGEITQDIIVEGAMQLAQENLGCENANDNMEGLKTAVLAQAKRELAKSLSEASAPAAGADAKPTNAHQILQTANDATRTAGRLGARYVALNAGAYAISFVSPVVAFLAYYTLGTLDVAGAAKNYVSPSRTENGKTLTEAEVTIITQKVKAAAAGFNGVTNWNADSLTAYENDLSNVSRKDLVDAAQRWAAAHPRNANASELHKARASYEIAKEKYNALKYPSWLDKHDLVDARLTLRLEEARLEIDLQKALRDEKAITGAEKAAAKAEYKLARFQHGRIAAEEEARLAAMNNPTPDEVASSMTVSLRARCDAARISVENYERLNDLEGQVSALVKLAEEEHRLKRVEVRGADTPTRDVAVCEVWVNHQKRLVELYGKAGLKKEKIQAALVKHDYLFYQARLGGADHATLHELKVKKWTFAKDLAEELHDGNLKKEVTLNLAVLQPNFPAGANDAARAMILAKANSEAHRFYAGSDLDVAYNFLEAQSKASKVAAAGKDLQGVLESCRDLQKNLVAHAHYIGKELVGLDPKNPNYNMLKAIEQGVLQENIALSRELARLAKADP